MQKIEKLQDTFATAMNCLTDMYLKLLLYQIREKFAETEVTCNRFHLSSRSHHEKAMKMKSLVEHFRTYTE